MEVHTKSRNVTQGHWERMKRALQANGYEIYVKEVSVHDPMVFARRPSKRHDKDCAACKTRQERWSSLKYSKNVKKNLSFENKFQVCLTKLSFFVGFEKMNLSI